MIELSNDRLLDPQAWRLSEGGMTLRQVVQRLDSYNDELMIWARVQTQDDLTPDTEAVVAPARQDGSTWWEERGLSYVLEVGVAKEAIEVWRRGRVPGNPKLIVSACEGRLAVGALGIAPERAVYYLVGDQAAVGEVTFTFGGQPGGTWPRRYLVDVDHAIAVAQDFLATGTVEQSTGPRDRTSW